MNVNQDMSFLSLISQASITVQAVMAILAIVSLMSWTFIIRKRLVIKQARKKTDQFEEDFWRGGDLNVLYQSIKDRRGDPGAAARIFEAGMTEFVKSRQLEHDVNTILDSSRRAMRAAYQREMDNLESSLSFLASTGSVSPYVGLFGTVWGIMHAFRALANVESATLSSVAPGIAEALVATAIGLFAAIPAVVAYNSYSHHIDRLSVRFENFIDEFSNILQRQVR
ncbi:MAG: protein TolQ [Pigmentiphaga sp.]|nr:protein TolQ [Pigmentiphaga sp.]